MSITQDTVVNLVIESLSQVSEPTPTDIASKVDQLLSESFFAAFRPQREELISQIRQRFVTFIGESTELVDNRDHIEWLSETDTSSWRFWNRYRHYLAEVTRLPNRVLSEVDRSSDRVLALLESPSREGQWDRRGMVVGQVQSGKTSHYTALIAKAFDAGYRCVVVLAGLHNNLRSQTQSRIDECIIGVDSQRLVEEDREVNIGVRLEDIRLKRQSPPRPITLTSRAENGDFSKQRASASLDPRDQYILLVVKKNVGVLGRLVKWLRGIARTVDPAGRGEVLGGVPCLMIDDEADHASIDTRDPDLDPTRTNQRIRELLQCFSQRCYVGYTATPFANIFIEPRKQHDSFGEDLFPRSFIINLKTPSNHFGPLNVFGHPGDDSVGLPEKKPLPVYCEVSDAGDWLPPTHKSDTVVDGMPNSLKEAIRSFVLVSAARRVRGQTAVHNSMLIHVTRYKDVQRQIHTLVTAYLEKLRNTRLNGAVDSYARLTETLRTDWERVFAEKFQDIQDVVEDSSLSPIAWIDVESEIDAALRKIDVRLIHGGSKDALDYIDQRDVGISIIAIGGDKLSRGLTLEGLSISYFTRTSRMYDTLLQMGRWFGYRPGYVDLCRLWCPERLRTWYRHIALASEELCNELDYMADCHMTPEDYGLKVRTHPDGLLVTARNKMRAGEEVLVRFCGELVQTIIVDRNSESNLQAAESLIAGLGTPALCDRNIFARIWTAVKPEAIIRFLTAYHSDTPAFAGSARRIVQYINEQQPKRELNEWSVVLMSKGSGRSWTLGGQQVSLLTRGTDDSSQDEDRYSFGALVGSIDEALDLTPAEHAEALQRTREGSDRNGKGNVNAKTPKRQIVREVRPPMRGLLLIYPLDVRHRDASAPLPAIGVAMSFPTSETSRELCYEVNPVELRNIAVMRDLEDAD